MDNELLKQYTNEIALAVIGAIVIYLRIWVSDLKKRAEDYLAAKTTKEQRQTLEILGREGFAFAETVYKELKGPEKLAEAIKYAGDKAAKVGLPFTFEELRAAVERAWREDKKKVSAI